MNKPQSTELLFELSHPGRRAHRLPACDVPTTGDLPASARTDAPPPLPEVGEIDLIRHFVNLSVRNMSIDTNFYPDVEVGFQVNSLALQTDGRIVVGGVWQQSVTCFPLSPLARLNPDGTAGDLYAVVQIVMPPKLSDREQALMKELAAASTFNPRQHLG